MTSIITTISPLFFSFSLLCLGHGLLNSLLSVRAAAESFSSVDIGLMGFFYFFGFVFGIYLCTKLIKSVGHIRTFAALASISSALSISFLLFLNPLSWIIFRFAYGVCIASLYMVIETWLNTLSSKEFRAQILSVYMILIYSCLGLSQFLMKLGSLESSFPFILVSILLSFSVVPLCISARAKPVKITLETLPFTKILQTSQYGIITCFIGGIVVGAIWSLMGAYLEMQKTPENLIPIYLSMIFFGALLFQYPLGKASDRMSSRLSVIQFTSLAGGLVFFMMVIIFAQQKNSIITSILFLLMGGFTFPLYSLSMAEVIDHTDVKHIIKVSGSLLLINSIGSMLGSILSALAMKWISADAFLYCNGVFLLVNTLCAYFVKKPQTPTDADTPFVAMPRTTTILPTMDPRIPEEVLSDTSPITK